MADSDKDILITPNTGAATDPSIVFSSGATGGDDVTLFVTDDGTITTLSIEGSAGQLFSVSNDLTGIIFSVNDISGIPSLEVNADGTVSIAEFDGDVGIGTSSPSAQLHVIADSATTNADIPVIRITSTSTGTPATGIGPSIEFESETAAGSPGNLEIGGVLALESTDVTATTEDFDFVFSTMAAGAAAAERMRITSTGNVTATSFGGITEANLVDKTAAETITGAWDFNAGATVLNGLDFGSVVGASATDLTEHIALWGSTYGFNVTSNTLNVTAAGTNTLSSTSSLITSRVAHDFDGNVTGSGSNTLSGFLSIEGITSANLVDKSANETITGTWTIDKIITGSNSVATETDILLTDNGNIGATQSMNFITDTDNTQTGTAFKWLTNAPGETSATTVMTLNENGNLVGVGTLTGFTSISAATIGGITEANLLDKTATETISGSYTFSANPYVSSAAPQYFLQETGVTADNTIWSITADGEVFSLRAWNDAVSVQSPFMQVNRTGTTIDAIDFTATNIDANGNFNVTNGLDVTGGSLTLATALDETYGGTGQTTYATGDILYASGANTLTKLAAGTNTHVLTLTGGVPTWAAAPGGGGITGTVANDQVVVGTGASTVDSSSSFTFDGATLAVTASTAHNFYSGAASSIARFGRNANENFRFDVTDGNSTITLDQDETDATSHQFLLNIESANTGARGFEFQDNGTMVMEIDFLNNQITTDGVDFAMTKLGSEGDTILKIEADSDNLVEASNAIVHLTQDGEAVHATFETQDTGNLIALTSGTTFAGRTTVISWPYNSTTVSFAGAASVAGVLNANGGIAFNDVTDTIAGIQNQNLLDKTATETVSGAYTFSNAGNVLSGNITSTVNSNTGVEVGYLGINSTSGSDGHGLSLYNGYVDGEPTYGIMFAQTATFGTHGDVSNDWATYFTMNTTANRGWIWREAGTANLASLSNEGTFTLGENNILQPWISVDSVSTGDNWTNQGAGISVGESGKKGSAAIHMTYNGDGSGYVGMGAVDNTAGTGGRPAFGHIDFTYNNDVIGLRSQVQVIGGTGAPYLRVYDDGDADYINIAHDGTDIVFSANGTTDLRLETTIGGQLVLENQALDHWFVAEGNDTIRTIKYPQGGYYKNDASGQTGAFRITWPITAGQNAMVHLTIRGYDYAANTGPWEVHIGGYDNSSGAWNNQSAYSTGAPPFDVVYFETDNTTTNHYVRLGDYTDTHQYPQVWIEEIAIGFSAQGSAWDTGWDISLVTSGTGISTATTERLFRQYGVTNDVYMNFGAAQDVYFTGATIGYFFDDNVNVQAGNSLIVNGTGGDYISISHDGTDVTMANLGTRYIDMELTSVLEFRVQDSDGATGRTSGAQVKSHGQTMRDVGFNVLPTFNLNASDTLEARHCGHVTGKTNTSLYTLTGPTSSDTDWPVGAVTTVMNLGTSGNYLINDTTTCTMYLMEGDGTAPADIVGTCTLGPGGVATLYRYSTAAIYIWGSGITL